MDIATNTDQLVTSFIIDEEFDDAGNLIEMLGIEQYSNASESSELTQDLIF